MTCECLSVQVVLSGGPADGQEMLLQCLNEALYYDTLDICEEAQCSWLGFHFSHTRYRYRFTGGETEDGKFILDFDPTFKKVS